jgi:hypothetical protein
MSNMLPTGHTTAIPDRYIWLGLAAFAFIAAKGIRAAITESTRRAAVREAWKQNAHGDSARPGGPHLEEQDPIVRGTTFDDSEERLKEAGRPKPQPEDCTFLLSCCAKSCQAGNTDKTSPAISISTLNTLIRSPNPSIALAAQSLLCNRLNAKASDTAKWLAADLRSSDEKAVQQAKHAVDWLLESGLAPDVLSALHATGAWRNGGCGWEAGLNEDGFPEDNAYVRESNILAARNLSAYGEENFFGGGGGGAAGGSAGRRDFSLMGMDESQRRRRMIEEANRAIDVNFNAARRRARREAVVVGNDAAEGSSGEVDGGDGATLPSGWWVV